MPADLRATLFARAADLRRSGVDNRTAFAQAAREHLDAVYTELRPLTEAMARRKEEPAQPPSATTQISEQVSQLTRDWLRKPDIHILGSMDEAPEPVRRVFEQQNSNGAQGDVEGFHWRGGVYLVADAMHSPADVQRVLFHEALGHFGLRGVFGDSLRPILDEVSGSMPQEVRRKALQYGADYNDPQQRRMAAEEVLAELAQTRPELGVVQRAVAAIRTWLRAHGIDSLQMTRDEIVRNFIEPARGWVERGRAAASSDEVRFHRASDGTPSDPDLPEFSRGPAVRKDADGRPMEDSAGRPIHPTADGRRAFWDWFGDSKVVDEQRRPLVVYHGTDANFGEFTPDKNGLVFVTPNPEFAAKFAQRYAGISGMGENIMPLYAKAKRPFDPASEADRKKLIDYLMAMHPSYTMGDGQQALVVNGRKTLYTDTVLNETLKDPESNWSFLENKSVVDAVERAGFDSMYVTEDGVKNLALFSPEQIKSAIGNRGTFDENSADVRFSRKGTTAATEGMPETAPTSQWERSKSILSDLIDEGLSRYGVYRFTSPMSEGSVRSRAAAQNWANADRLARYQWLSISSFIEKRFTPEQRRKMWEAADEQNTLLQQGLPTAGRGLERLTPEERDVVEQLHTYGEELLRRAKNAGMFQGEGLPYWTPRMMVMLDEHGEFTKPMEPGKKATSGGEGRNVFTTSGNLKQRKYLSVEETEAAMKAKGGELVRDIMTMPLAMQRLERAIAGRELINQIKDLGAATGAPTVATGRPDHEGWFTLDHAAFTTWRPRFERDEATGKMRALLDENGNVIFDRVPLYMSKEFEGPIRAILSNNDGTIYRGLMLLKSKSMAAIMFSPLIHLQTILGRVVAYGKTPIQTATLFYKGFALRHDYDVLGGLLKGKEDHALMRTAIEGGMVPMGYHRNGMIDVTDVARGFGREGGAFDPHESWVAHGSQAITKAVFGKVAGTKVKNFIDHAGDIWHGTLLWNRIADIQMGVFAHAYESLQAKGFAPGVAKVMAAHWANRYAGAIARENMGEAARKAANILLFSRSFNMGNLGTIKDLAFGMPSGMRAKIEAEYGRAAASQAFATARRKAWAGWVRDYAIYLIAGGVASAAIDRLKKDKGWDEIFGGYVDRAQRMAENIKQHPLTPGSYAPNRLLPTYDNEPGKQDRIDLGPEEDSARHAYGRLPTGKVVEDMFNWMMHPTDTFVSKMSPLAKAVGQVLVNDKGFGVPVFEPSEGFWKSAEHVAEHLAKSQVPWDTIVTAWDKLHGKTNAVEDAKLLGNVTGFTISQGHPQGPEAGVAAELEEHIHAQKLLAMEEVKRLLRYGKDDLAREKLEGIGLSPREATQIIKHIEQPTEGMTRNQMKRFNQHGTEEDQQRMGNVTR